MKAADLLSAMRTEMRGHMAVLGREAAAGGMAAARAASAAAPREIRGALGGGVVLVVHKDSRAFALGPNCPGWNRTVTEEEVLALPDSAGERSGSAVGVLWMGLP